MKTSIWNTVKETEHYSFNVFGWLDAWLILFCRTRKSLGSVYTVIFKGYNTIGWSNE